MTTTDSGQKAARIPRPGRLRPLILCLLCAAAVPAFAHQNTLDNNNLNNANAASPALADAMASSDRTLMESTLNLRAGLDAGLPVLGQPQAPQATGRVQAVLQKALALLGTPYRWGGTSPDGGFDCSGMVGYVFRSALGIELPRVSREMAKDGEKVDKASLAVGDLVFFSRRGKRVDHVGIYVGEGRFVHAPRTGRDVTVSSLDDGYWSRKFMQARRVTGV